jgi:hypothetical protein
LERSQSLGLELRTAAPLIDEREHTYNYVGLPVYHYPVSLNSSRAEVRGEVLPEYFDVFRTWMGHLRPDIVDMHSYTRSCNCFHAQYVK